MDITVCQVDYTNKQVQIGCANHIVFIVSGDTIEMIEGDIYSIGGLFTILQKPIFSNHIIPIDRDMSIYIFSDGYQDQFGGEKNQKFMLNKFKDLIFSLRHLPMEEQKTIFYEEHLKWKGNFRQIDDILVIGIKIHK
jgi:serine phosphatase RsbU (regulator of sigma subunit)